MRSTARLAALACAFFVPVAVAGPTTGVSIEAPDGSVFTMPASSTYSYRPLPGGGVEATHGDAFLTEAQLPLVLTRVGEPLRFRLDGEATSVLIGHTGGRATPVKPAPELAW